MTGVLAEFLEHFCSVTENPLPRRIVFLLVRYPSARTRIHSRSFSKIQYLHRCSSHEFTRFRSDVEIEASALGENTLQAHLVPAIAKDAALLPAEVCLMRMVSVLRSEETPVGSTTVRWFP